MNPLELTGTPLFVLVVVLAVLVLLAAVLWLPRHRGPGIGKYVLQFVSIVLVSVLTLVALFLRMNADNVWYGSWSDLLSGGTGGDVTSTSLGTVPTVHRASETLPHRPFTTAQTDPGKIPDIGSQLSATAPDGQWASFRFQGPTTGVDQQVTVWLPPSYMKDPHRTYPVITAFTGFPGTVQTYEKAMQFDTHLTNAVRTGTMREAVVVIPDLYPGNLDTECLDSSRGRFESFVTQDLNSWVRANLRVSTDPKAWTTLGYSAGGWCSSMFTVLHPGTWASSVNLAGYFAPEFSEGQHWKLADPSRYDLARAMTQHRPEVNIWFFAGGDDHPALRALKGFEPSVKAPSGMVSNVSESGAHRSDLWAAQLENAFAWLGKTSPCFAPLPHT